jgi:phenylpyruvate tautomerase PptA (4-oxalocrotonate tautomerase family)
MPMIDAWIPMGAIRPEAERRLMARLTDILLEAEGMDVTNPNVRNASWVFLHRPTEVFVAGAPAEAPRYRIVCTVPEGQFDDARRAALVPAVTEAVMDAEEGTRPRNPGRVWVFPTDVPEGAWGSRGAIQRLADIMNHFTGDRAYSDRYAARRLAAGRPAPQDA